MHSNNVIRVDFGDLAGCRPPCYPPQHSGLLCASSRHLGRTPAGPRRPGAPVARDRPWCRVRCADTPIRASPWLLFRLFPDQSIHLGTVSSRSQVGHVVARFTSIRDWRAVLFVTTFWSLVREYSSLGLCAGQSMNVLVGWFRATRVAQKANRRRCISMSPTTAKPLSPAGKAPGSGTTADWRNVIAC